MLTILAAIGCLLNLGVHAQAPTVRMSEVASTKGDLVTPLYEGWYEVDGTTYALFGYYNRNTEEVINVPIGPENKMSPGAIDQGQPTRFFPGRNAGVFAVAVPAKTEVTWTLTANGQTFAIPTTLDQLYLIAPQKTEAGTYPGNTPPVVKFEATGASAQGPAGITVTRTAKVSQPIPLEVWVTDDGLPPPPGATGVTAALRATPGRDSGGLTVTWKVWRGGPGEVSFSPESPKIEGGKARTEVTFSSPGDYMLALAAVDSKGPERCCWTHGYVKVTVQP
jgi:hypothetical protein